MTPQNAEKIIEEKEAPANRYVIDPTACEAYGFCFDVAGDLFDGDDWGYAKAVKTVPLTGAERERAELAFQKCPVKAVRRLPK